MMDEWTSARLDRLHHEYQERLDAWETRTLFQLRNGFVVASDGTATATYNVDEYNELLWLRSRRVFWLWMSRYPNMQHDGLWASVDYALGVVDKRVGLRKSFPRTYLDRYVRAAVREQVDGIIASLDDIKESLDGWERDV
jgi:hypothetical protein